MRRYLGCFLIPCFLLATASSSATQKGIDVKGWVREIDAKQGTITVDLKGGSQQTYSLAKADLPVKDGRGGPMKLADVKAGRKVTLTLARGTDVAEITVAPSFKVGTVVQVNKETREIEFLSKNEKFRFTIAKDAHYFRSERTVAPLDLRPGARMKLYYLPENREVIVINYKDLDEGS